MNDNEPIRQCSKCKIIKPIKLFYIYKYCKKCHIKNYIEIHLLNARVANHFNLSIDEFDNIMKINMYDPKRNRIGKHERYDEIMTYIQSVKSSTIITEYVINDFLEEPLDIYNNMII